MSSLGIDFGTHSTVVAIARKKGIDIVPNEISNRLTPSIVVFGEDKRYIGESGLANVISNFANSITGIKRLLERRYSDPDVAEEQKFTNAELVEDESDGMVCARVNVKGEVRTFSFVQLAAMFFSEIDKFTLMDTGSPIKTVVVSCPVWYTDIQKRAILDSCQIIGIEPIMVINDLTAASLLYGITKFDLPDSSQKDSSPRLVLLFDMGYSSVQVCVAKFFNSHSTVISHAFDRSIGGRNIDQMMTLHYATAFSQKYNIDILSNKKAFYRLRQACERTKKVLSANPVTVLNVECLMNDIDVTSTVKREELEELINPLVPAIEAVVHKALALAGVGVNDIEFFELIGASSRVPRIRKILVDIFGHSKLSATLNMDEAVARGCAIQCAIASPKFKVRNYSVNDWNPYPLELHWDAKYSPQTVKTSKPHEISTIAFPVGNIVPSSKLLTLARVFNKNETLNENSTYDFVIGARYHEDISKMNVIQLKSPLINTFIISGIKKCENDPSRATIKIQLKLGQSGVIMIETAYQIDEITDLVPVEPEAPKETPGNKGIENNLTPEEGSGVKNGDKPETLVNGGGPGTKNQHSTSHTPQESESDKSSLGNECSDADQKKEDPEEKSTAPPPKQMKLVKKQVKYPLGVVTFGNRKSQAKLQEYIEIEQKLSSEDRVVVQTAELRNSLEEYVYNSRANISEAWGPFVTPEEVELFLTKLSEIEVWLYSDDVQPTMEEYSEKLKSVKTIGDKFKSRLDKFLEEQKKERLKKEEELRRIAMDEEKKKMEEVKALEPEVEMGPNIEEEPCSEAAPSNANADDVTMDVSEPGSDSIAMDQGSEKDVSPSS